MMLWMSARWVGSLMEYLVTMSGDTWEELGKYPAQLRIGV